MTNETNSISITKNGIEYDRWIIGKASDKNRKYVMHLAEPRFVAKFSDQNLEDEDEISDEELLQSLPIYVGDIVFFNVLFFDEPPGDEESLMSLFTEASSAINRAVYRGKVDSE